MINGLVPGQAEIATFKLHKDHPMCGHWRNLFFRTFREIGTIATTCDALGIKSSDVRKLIQTDPEFAESFQDARLDTQDKLEAEVIRRAMNGSDVLLMFAMKKLDPTYKDNYQQPTANLTVNVKTYVGFDPDAWDKMNPETAKIISVEATPVLDINEPLQLVEQNEVVGDVDGQ